MKKIMTHEELIYTYPLYSIKRFPQFLHYCKPTAKAIANQMGGGKNWVAILADMVWCNLRYGAMDSRDYLLFEFWKKSASERNSFFTKRRYFRLLKHFDKETFCHPDGKAWIYRKYADFIKREWIYADSNTPPSHIDNFFEKHGEVLVKPLSSEQGKGITMIRKDAVKEIENLKDEIRKHPFLLEELCRNCTELDAINKSSLNTLRVFTIVDKNDEIKIVSTSLRCGCGNSVVDNWGSGGVCYPVDIESGIVYMPGVDKKGIKYICHPGSDTMMPGFRIPRYQEACQMAVDIIKKDRRVVYAGHDIAILPDRCELIEVNFPGGHDILQAIDQVGKNYTMKTVQVAK